MFGIASWGAMIRCGRLTARKNLSDEPGAAACVARRIRRVDAGKFLEKPDEPVPIRLDAGKERPARVAHDKVGRLSGVISADDRPRGSRWGTAASMRSWASVGRRARPRGRA